MRGGREVRVVDHGELKGQDSRSQDSRDEEAGEVGRRLATQEVKAVKSDLSQPCRVGG